MGFQDREYYRDATRGSGFLTGESPAVKIIIFVNVVVYLGQLFNFVPTELFEARAADIFGHYKIWELLTAAFPIVASESSRVNPSTAPKHIAYSRASPRAEPTPAAAAWPEARTARMFGNGSVRERARGEVQRHAAEAVRGQGLAAEQLLLGCGVDGQEHAHPVVDVLWRAEVEVDAARVADLLPEELRDGDPSDAPDEFVHDRADRQPVIPVGLARPPVRYLRRGPFAATVSWSMTSSSVSCGSTPGMPAWCDSATRTATSPLPPPANSGQ